MTDNKVIQFIKPNGFLSKNDNQFVIREETMCTRYVNVMKSVDKASIEWIVPEYSAQFTNLNFSAI